MWVFSPDLTRGDAMSTADPLKVVVRLLPPEITEEEFRKTVSDDKLALVKWSSFLAGKRYKGEAKPSLNSRCYLQFEATAQAEEFISEYHGRKFIDAQGEEFRAVACFTPYQKVPRKLQKDPREGTIEEDSVYQEFIAALQEKAVFEAPEDPKASVRPLEPGDTPLLHYMKARALERKARWEKKQSRKKDWYAMETVEENPKRAKYRCSECGTPHYLEEDPDTRGTFYCTYCWEKWESEEAAAPKSKKKKKKAKEEEYWEEEAEDTSSKKKKKKKKDKEKEKDEGDWRAKETSASWNEYTYEEEPTESRRKKKKKKDKEEAAYEEESGGKWRAKGYEEDWGTQEWSEESSSRRSKKKKESKETEWWEEPQEKSSKSKRGKQDDWGKEDAWWEDTREEKSKSSRGDKGEGRWRAKAAEEESWGEEKPRRGKKDKGTEGDGGHWAPKSSKSSYYR